MSHAGKTQPHRDQKHREAATLIPNWTLRIQPQMLILLFFFSKTYRLIFAECFSSFLFFVFFNILTAYKVMQRKQCRQEIPREETQHFVLEPIPGRGRERKRKRKDWERRRGGRVEEQADRQAQKSTCQPKSSMK